MSVTDDAPKKRTLSIDEIHAILTEIATDDEAGADRFRALKLLRAEKEQDTILPAPMTEKEVIQRLERLNRAVGNTIARAALARTVRRSGAGAIEKDTKRMTADDLDIDVAGLPMTLKALYRKYPEMKRAGVPKGFPMKSSLLKQQDWIKKAALKIELERKRAQTAETLIEAETKDGYIGPGKPPVLLKPQPESLEA